MTIFRASSEEGQLVMLLDKDQKRVEMVKEFNTTTNMATLYETDQYGKMLFDKGWQPVIYEKWLPDVIICAAGRYQICKCAHFAHKHIASETEIIFMPGNVVFTSTTNIRLGRCGVYGCQCTKFDKLPTELDIWKKPDQLLPGKG